MARQSAFHQLLNCPSHDRGTSRYQKSHNFSEAFIRQRSRIPPVCCFYCIYYSSEGILSVLLKWWLAELTTCTIPKLFVQPDPSGIYRRKSQVGEVPAKPLVPTGLCQHGRKKSLGSSVLSGELLQVLPKQKCTHLRATSAVSMRRTPPETPPQISVAWPNCV